MIALPNIALRAPGVARTPSLFAHLDRLRDDAAHQMDLAFDGVAGKRIDLAHVPGCGRHGVSRAINGSDSNPLFRLAALFVLMKRLGMGRAKALRILEWLRSVVDQVWPPEEEAEDVKELIREEQAIDTEEDREQTAMLLGDEGARERWLELIARRRAHDAVLLLRFGQQG